jgi:hypothetical protein
VVIGELPPYLERVVIEEPEFTTPIIDVIFMLSDTFVASSLFGGDLRSKRVPGKDAGTIKHLRGLLGKAAGTIEHLRGDLRSKRV